MLNQPISRHFSELVNFLQMGPAGELMRNNDEFFRRSGVVCPCRLGGFSLLLSAGTRLSPGDSFAFLSISNPVNGNRFSLDQGAAEPELGHTLLHINFPPLAPPARKSGFDRRGFSWRTKVLVHARF